MKIGVTGANGFIGREVASTLRARGHEVHSLVRDVATAVQPARELDLVRRPLPPGSCDGLEALVHCAAYLPTSYSDAGEAQRCFDVNALGTLLLLQECARAGVRQVVHLSTNLYRLSRTAATEEAPFEPSEHASSYLVSKAAADFFATHSRRTLPVAILRLSSVYGPTLERGIVATLITRLLAGQPITVEDGNYQADFIHVTDVVNAVVAAVERVADGPYNIGSGTATRPPDLARILLDAVDAPRDLLLTKPAPSSELRGFCALDVTRARADLGFAPRSLVDGLRDVIEQMRARR